MMLVRHAMAAEPVSATPEMNAGDAAGLMVANDVGSIPITDDGRLVGLVTDRDLVLRVMAERKDPRSVRLGDIATTRGLETVTPDTQLCDARAADLDRRVRETVPIRPGWPSPCRISPTRPSWPSAR